MSKAEQFIQEHTNDCSNVSLHIGKYYEWITPHQARKAVEIAREEIYEWLRMNFCNYFDYTGETFDKCIDDLKQAMQDE